MMSSRSSSRSSRRRASDALLPTSNNTERPIVRFASLINHGLYRRLILWSVISLVVISIILYGTGEGSIHRLSIHIHKPDQPAGVPKSPERRPTQSTTQHDNGIKEKPDIETLADVEIEPKDAKTKEVHSKETKETKERWKEDVKNMPWLEYKL